MFWGGPLAYMAQSLTYYVIADFNAPAGAISIGGPNRYEKWRVHEVNDASLHVTGSRFTI